VDCDADSWNLPPDRPTFSVSGPTVWNSLSDDLRDPAAVDSDRTFQVQRDITSYLLILVTAHCSVSSLQAESKEGCSQNSAKGRKANVKNASRVV